MIPLYVSNTPLRGTAGMPIKNPIYFIRKSVGKSPAASYDVVVLNYDGTDTPIPSLTKRHNQAGLYNAYDVEMLNARSMFDAQVEPNAERDGSLAGQPRNLQTILNLTGFVRHNSYKEMQQAIRFLNYSFDPVINYLEGASTFDNTVTPSWQTFQNVGFSVLAWYDPSTQDDWRVESELEDEATDPFTLNPYERLNRLLFVRSIERPVTLSTKFGDMNTPFNIQLLAADPTVYEFITPATWLELAAQPTIDLNTVGELIDSTTSGAPGYISTEAYVRPSFPWRTGPGWREIDMDTSV